jgi:hypothetical protein
MVTRLIQSPLVTVERRLLNQRDEVVQEGETEHLVERRKP